MAVGAVSALLQPISGDFLAKFVFQTQKTKFAAMEGQFKTERYAPARIGGWPDTEAQVTRYAIEIPGGLSFMAASDRSTEVPGLDQTPREDWPNVHVTHLAFQVMVGLGSILMGVSVVFWLMRWRLRERAFDSRLLMWALVLSGPLGFLALEAGWTVTEVGRQPWIIHGVMRTRDAVTPAEGVQVMFYGFTALYLLLGSTVVVLLRRLGKPGKQEPRPVA